jgi:hypothetical protein
MREVPGRIVVAAHRQIRISVWPVASHTRTPVGTGITAFAFRLQLRRSRWTGPEDQ